MKLRRSPRLTGFNYVGSYAYSATLVTRRRAPVFRNVRLVELATSALNRASEKHGFQVLAYCFMPDHVHLLVAGSSDSRLSEFMRIFKQLSSYEAKRTTGEGLWQISYYDHVLRREEDLAQLARYIWENPVRAGLVSKRSDYPHSGPVPLMDG